MKTEIILNEEQLKLVNHPMDYPAACLAGAGSGKTATLTARVNYLMEAGIKPNRICAITFTNKAANELLERIGMASEHIKPRVTTIHSLALSAIRKNPTGFGLNEKVSPIDDYNQSQIVKKIAEDFKLEEFNAYNFLEKVSYHRVRGVGFRVDYTAAVHAQAQIDYSGLRAMTPDDLAVWKRFEEEKTKMSVVDFDDMLHLVVRRGETDEKWRNSIQKMFHHILMDEAQDTNVIQWKFINLLVGPDNKNLMVVGDLSQSIYGFSGASPNLLLDYTKSWRGLTPSLYKLERNHRSVPEVVRLANRTQKHMAGVIPIQMESHRGDQGEKGMITLRKGLTPREIAHTISDDIRVNNQLVEGRTAYKDTAILIRAGSMVRDIEPELVRNRIPYIIRGAMGLMQTEEVRDILSYMRIMSNPRDYFAMLRSISVPKRGVGDATLEKIRTLANKDHDGDLIEAAKAYAHIKFTMYLHLVDRLIEEKDNPLKVLEMIIKGTKYKDLIAEKYKKDKDKIEQKFANLKRLEEVIQSLLAANQLSTDDLVFQLTMQDQKDDLSKDGKVIISTIHAAKGLEWKTVYVVGCVESQLPHKWSQTENELGEERRVFYVACTRARDNLILCVPAMLEYFNKGNQFVAPSRFLTELGICK